MLESEITLVCLFTRFVSSVFSPLLLLLLLLHQHHHHHLSSSSTSACLLPSSLDSVSFCLVASSSHQLPLLCVLFCVRSLSGCSCWLCVFRWCVVFVRPCWTLLGPPACRGVSWWGSQLCFVALWLFWVFPLFNFQSLWLIMSGVQHHYHLLQVDSIFSFLSFLDIAPASPLRLKLEAKQSSGELIYNGDGVFCSWFDALSPQKMYKLNEAKTLRVQKSN